MKEGGREKKNAKEKKKCGRKNLKKEKGKKGKSEAARERRMETMLCVSFRDIVLN